MILKVLKELEWIEDRDGVKLCFSCMNKHPDERESDLRFARSLKDQSTEKDNPDYPEKDPMYAPERYGHRPDSCDLARAIQLAEMNDKLVWNLDTRRLGRETLIGIIASLRAEKQRDGYVIEPLTLGWNCTNEVCKLWNTDEKEFLLECRGCRSARPKVDSLETTRSRL